jgi:hypothetical protein
VSRKRPWADQHPQGHREADDRQAQGDREAVAGEEAEQAQGEHCGQRGLAAEDAEAGREADQRRGRRLPAGAGLGRGIHPREAVD